MESGDRIYHLALRHHWEEAQRTGAYRQSTIEKSLDDEGFIHCSYDHQVRDTADRFYGGRDDVIVLEVDPALVDAEIRVEQGFPHIYGPLPVEAVVRAEPFGV